jgi:hypothetical protein
MWLTADVQSRPKERLRPEPGVDVEHNVNLLDAFRDDLV